MANFFLVLLTIGVILIPFLYRIIRTGKVTLFNTKNDFGLDINYQKAEKVRVFQVVLVCLYLIYHSSVYWGWFNTFFFIVLVFFVSLFSEILGERTGYIFGGKYKLLSKTSDMQQFVTGSKVFITSDVINLDLGEGNSTRTINYLYI